MRVFVWRGRPHVLHEHGLDVVASESQLVIRVPPDDERIVDSLGCAHRLTYIDVDPADLALMECMNRVKQSWEEYFPDESHLGHAAAGLWFYYWVGSGTEAMEDLVRQGRSEDLRAAATDYIASNFGRDRGPALEQDHA